MKKLVRPDRSDETLDGDGVRRLVAAFADLGYVVSRQDVYEAYSAWSEDTYAAGWYILPEVSYAKYDDAMFGICARLISENYLAVGEEGPGSTVIVLAGNHLQWREWCLLRGYNALGRRGNDRAVYLDSPKSLMGLAGCPLVRIGTWVTREESLLQDVREWEARQYMRANG